MKITHHIGTTQARDFFYVFSRSIDVRGWQVLGWTVGLWETARPTEAEVRLEAMRRGIALAN